LISVIVVFCQLTPCRRSISYSPSLAAPAWPRDARSPRPLACVQAALPFSAATEARRRLCLLSRSADAVVEGNLQSSSHVLDYLLLLGLKRVECLTVWSKAGEHLFWESQKSATLIRPGGITGGDDSFGWAAPEAAAAAEPEVLAAELQDSDEEALDGVEELGEEEADESEISLAQVESVVDFLLAIGCERARLPQLISSHPPLLAYDVDSRLRPTYEYLSTLGVGGTEFAAAICARPSLLGLDERSFRTMVTYLQSVDTDPEKVKEYVLTSL